MRKIRSDGESLDVSRRLGGLCGLLEQVPGFAALYVYGSYGTSFQTPLSDIDVAVLFTSEDVPGFEEELRLRGLVTESLGEDDVSIAVLNRAPLAFQFEVVSKGRCLFVRDEVADADFREQTASRFGDFGLDFAAFSEDYDRALCEEFSLGAG